MGVENESAIQELAVRYAQSKQSADLDALVRASWSFVRDFVKRKFVPRRRRGYDANDFIQEGMVALLQAADRYDPSKGPFIPYAQCWIRALMLSPRGPVLDSWADVGPPPACSQAAKAFWGLYKQALFYETCPSDEQIEALARRLGVKRQLIVDMIVWMSPSLRLDARRSHQSDPGSEPLREFVPSDTPTPEQLVAEKELRDRLRTYINQLRPKYGDRADILDRAIRGDGGETLEQVAARWGVTKERARQVEQRALSDLRKAFTQQHMAAAV